jgi:hypothetical protein
METDLLLGAAIWFVGNSLLAVLFLRFTSSPGLHLWTYLVFLAIAHPLGFLIVRPFYGLAGMGKLGFVTGIFIVPAVVAWTVLRVGVAVFRKLRGTSSRFERGTTNT